MSNQWERIAVEQANRCTDELFEVHRGAYLLYRPNVYVIFGNDGHTIDPEDVVQLPGRKTEPPPTWPKREAEMVCQSIESNNLSKLLAFGLSDDGYTWVCVLSSQSPEIGMEELNMLVWGSCAKAMEEFYGEDCAKKSATLSNAQWEIARDSLESMALGDIPPSLN